MTPEEHTRRFAKTINDLKNNYNGNLMANVGVHALNMIYKRVTETGVNAKGSKFAPYSIKPMLMGGKALKTTSVSALLGSKEKRKNLEWRTVKGKRLFILQGGYKQYRELWGKQTNHVDFFFGGNMWNDISLISSGTDHQKGIAIIGAKNPKEKEKLVGNTKRKGDILDLSQKEINELKQTYTLDVLQVFKNNGL